MTGSGITSGAAKNAVPRNKTLGILSGGVPHRPGCERNLRRLGRGQR